MRRTKEEAQKTRESILKSALHLFSQKGVAETSLQDIADKAQVTRGAIYWHFQNKSEIFDALHDIIHQPLSELLLDSIEQDHPQPLEQVKHICIELLLDLEKNSDKKQALTLFMSPYVYKGDLAHLRDKHLEKKRECSQKFKLFFERALDKDMLPPGTNTEILHTALKCYMKGIITEFMNDPENMDLKHNAERLMTFFFSRLI